MKSLVTAFCAVWFFGCAQDYVPTPNDLSVKDFTPADDPMVEPENDAGSDGSVDLHATDGAHPDLAMPDLKAPADLSPVQCDLSPGTSDAGMVARLYLAGIVSTNLLATASFTDAGGWSLVAVDGAHPVADVAITTGPSSLPVIIARQSDTGGTLAYAVQQPCTGLYAPLAPLYAGAATSNRPSLAGGPTVDVVFRGMFDNHLYHASFAGSTWTTGTQLALLTDQWPAATRQGGVLHAVHTGTTGGQLYDAPLGAAALTITGATSGQGPAAVVTADDTLYVVFLGTDTNLYWIKRATGSTTFSAPVQLCNGLGASCLDVSDKQPILALRSDGKPLVVWHGKTDNHLYTSTLTDGGTPLWSAAIEATGGETTNSLPALATGVGSAGAELVYVRASDGAARHTRLTTSWNTAATIGNQTFSSTPALATSN